MAETDRPQTAAAAPPTVGSLLGLPESDMKFGTAFALFGGFARSTMGKVLVRGTWAGIAVLAGVVIVAAVLH